MFYLSFGKFFYLWQNFFLIQQNLWPAFNYIHQSLTLKEDFGHTSVIYQWNQLNFIYELTKEKTGGDLTTCYMW